MISSSTLFKNISTILDIGANIGQFTMFIRNSLPKASIHMIEANYNCEEYLKTIAQIYNYHYTIAVLSDSIKEVDFYLTSENNISTGSSYYLEKTDHFSKEKLIVQKRTTNTLDNLFPNDTFDLIKLDTQGSELDIINGGINLVSRAKALLIECSTKEYNIGSPLLDKVYKRVIELGFTKTTPVTQLSSVGQIDVLFIRP